MDADKVLWVFTNLGSFLSSYQRVFQKAQQQAEHSGRGHWEELNGDIMEKIISFLDAKSIASVKSVCKSWQSLFTQQGLRTPKNPWLLLPHSHSFTTLNFYDMFSHRTNIYSINVSRPIRGGQVCGSCKGWLVVAKNLELFLFNPLSAKQHKLPPLPFPDDFDHDAKDCQTRASLFIDQIELSSNDLSECVVSAIMDDLNMLACCRPKDKCWTIFNNPKSEELGYSYMGFCYETLYVGTFENTPWRALEKDFKVATESFTMKLDGGRSDDMCDINLKLFPSIKEASLITTRHYANLGVDEGRDVLNYLVESNKNDGVIFLVRKYIDSIYAVEDDGHDDENEDEDEEITHKTRSFKVFELIPCKDGGDDSTVNSYSVKRVEILDDTQDALFVGRGSAFIHSFDTNTSRKVGNQIYYTDDLEGNVVSRETGVFHIGEGKLKQCLPSIDLPRHSHMYWFAPSLQF